MYVLNEQTHSSIVSMDLYCLSLNFPESASSTVGSAAPKRVGSSSSIPTNSCLHTFSAILCGIGGDVRPTRILSEADGVDCCSGCVSILGCVMVNATVDIPRDCGIEVVMLLVALTLRPCKAAEVK